MQSKCSQIFVLWFVLLFCAVYSHAQVSAELHNDGGLGGYTPFNYFSNGESVNLTNGNFSRSWTGPTVPGRGGMQMGFTATVATGQTELVLDEFSQDPAWAWNHATDENGNVCRSGECKENFVSGSVSSIKYLNKTVHAPGMGVIVSQYDPNDPTKSNRVTYDPQISGWDVSWAPVRGLIVATDMGTNRSDMRRYAYLVLQGGVVESIQISDGKSETPGSSYSVLKRLGSNPVEEEEGEWSDADLVSLDNEDALEVFDDRGALYVLQRYGTEYLQYEATYKDECGKLFWVHDCEHKYTLDGWRFDVYVTAEQRDRDGNSIVANPIVGDVGKTQTLEMYLAPQTKASATPWQSVRREIAEDGEVWIAPGMVSARKWHLQRDAEQRIASITDAEGRAHTVEYDAATAYAQYPRVRKLGLEHMNDPDVFMQVTHPTGGVYRYEQYVNSDHQQAFVRHVIATEIPNLTDSTQYHQKYYRIRAAVSDEDNAEDLVSTDIHFADGSSRQLRYSQRAKRLVLDSDAVHGAKVNERRNYTWAVVSTHEGEEESGERVQGVGSVTVTRDGYSYLEQAYTYDSEDRVITSTNAAGDVETTTYVVSAPMLQQAKANVLQDPEARELLWNRVQIQARERGVDSDTHKWNYAYGGTACNVAQPLHRMISQEHWVNELLIERESYCYDAVGNIVSLQSGAKPPYEMTTMTYDNDAVYPRKKQVGDEDVVEFTYDPTNGVLLSQSRAGETSHEGSYNAEGQLLSIHYGNSYSVVHSYLVGVAGGNVITSEELVGGKQLRKIERYYDGLGRMVKVVRGESEWKYTYDSNGRLASTVYPGGKSVALQYDVKGRPVYKMLSGIEGIRYVYELRPHDGAYAEYRDMYLGEDDSPIATKVRNLRGQVIQNIRYDQEIAHAADYAYDVFGELRYIQAPNGATMRRDMAWDVRQIKRHYSSGETIIESDLDGHGFPQRLSYADTNGNGHSLSYGYDAQHRLQSITSQGDGGDTEQVVVNVEYGAPGSNAAQRIERIADQYGSTQFWYGSHGHAEGIEREVEELDQKYVFHVEKDAYGNPVRMVYPHGLVLHYHRDAENRVTRITRDAVDGMELVRVEYGASGSVSSVQYANDVATQYDYDAAGRVQQIVVSQQDRVFLDERYVYDRYGNKQEVRHADGSRVVYSYDGLNRLVEAEYYDEGSEESHAKQSYTYDAAGNRIAYKDSAVELTYTMALGSQGEATNQLKKYEGTGIGVQFTYEHGSMVKREHSAANGELRSTEYGYDERQRITSINRQGAGASYAAKYTYDYRGRRESVESGGGTTYYGYGDSDEPLIEINAAGEVERSHIYIGGRRVAMIDGDTIEYVHADELGSTLALTNESAQLVQQVRYAPFGAINFMQGTSENKYLYAGKSYDPDAGLIYFGRRYYDPSIGRYLQRDAYGQGVNHYVYVENNPLIRRDVLGLFFTSFGVTSVYSGPAIREELGGVSQGFVFPESGGDIVSVPAPLPDTSPLAQGAGSISLTGAFLSAGLYALNHVIPVPTAVNRFFGGIFGEMQRAVEMASAADSGKKSNASKKKDKCGKTMSCVAELEGWDELFGLENVLQSSEEVDSGEDVFDAPQQEFLVQAPGEEGLEGGGQASTPDVALPANFEDERGLSLESSAAQGVTSTDVVGEFADTPDKASSNVQEELSKPLTQAEVNDVSDPVMLHSGDLLQTQQDLRIAGRGLDYQFQRTYRSRVEFEGPLGHGWDHNYNKYLVIREAGEEVEDDYGSIARFDGTARFDVYERQKDGSYKTPYGRFDVLRKHSDGSYSIRDRYGDIQYYNAAGQLTKIEDPSGNALHFTYAAVGDQQRLSTVVDSLNRTIQYEYFTEGPAQGLLQSVTDFDGRSVQFTYSAERDLATVTSPATTAFPNGRTTSYTYTTGHPEDRSQLNHNLLTVTDAAGNVYLENTYSIFDRVVRQRFGDIGEFQFEYRQLSNYVSCEEPEHADLAMYRTRVRDRSGNETLWDYNCQGNPLRKEEFTRSIRNGDPSSYVTSYRYDLHGQLLEETAPLGNRTEYVYQDMGGAVAPLATWSSGNLTKLRKIPDTRGGAVLETRYRYEPIYNKPTNITDPASNITQLWYDYQEGTAQSVLADVLKVDNADLTPWLADVPLNLGDLNGDAITAQHAGKLVRVDQPTTTTLDEVQQQHRRRFQYNTHGQLVRHIDGAGVITDLAYENDYLQQVTQDSGGLNLVTSYGRDTRGNITSVTDAKGATYYTYSELDQITSITDPLGAQTQYHYNANTKLARIDRQHLLADGSPAADPWVSTRFDYNMLDRVTLRHDEVSADQYIVTEYQYDANENVSRVIQPEGNSITISYDERDLPYVVTQGAGSNAPVVTSYSYDANQNLSATQDGLNATTQHFYDGHDRRIRTRDPLGAQQRFEYNALGQQTAQRHYDKNELLLTEQLTSYDALGRRIQQQAAKVVAGEVLNYRDTFFDYNQQHAVVAIEDPLSAVHKTLRDNLGRITDDIDPAGNITKFTYDARSNVLTRNTQEQHATLGLIDHITTYTYDAKSQRTSQTNPLGHRWNYQYDSLGRLTQTSDPKDVATVNPGATTGPGNIVRYSYDGIGRQTHVHAELREGGVGAGALLNTLTTQQHWDDNSRLTGITDAAGNETRYSYDAVNRRTHTTMPDGAAYVIGYDAASRMNRVALPNGTAVDFTYDATGNLLERLIFANGTPAGKERMDYDALGRMTQASVEDMLGNASHTLSYHHDSFGNILTETQHGDAITRSYTARNALATLSYSDGPVLSYDRDAIDRITTIAFTPEQPLATYTHAGKTRRASTSYGNASSASFAYTGAQQLATYQWTSGATTIAQHALHYDQLGNLLLDAQPANAGQGDLYQYDSLSRLAHAALGVPNAVGAYGPEVPSDFSASFAYDYDAAHNWSSATTQAGPSAAAQVTSFERNALNQYVAETLTAEGQPDQTREYVYDASGNLLEDDIYRYTYNWRNAITEVHWLTDNQLVARYGYDAQGRRVSKYDATTGESTRYIYDGWQVIEERDLANNLLARYTYSGLDTPVTMTRGEATYYYHTNHQGSVIALTGENGQVVERYTYDPFGQVSIMTPDGAALGSSQVDNPYFYTARRYDPETDLYHYRHRSYSTRLGRFLQRDPLGYIDGENLYAYVRSNPLNATDPYGLVQQMLYSPDGGGNSDPRNWHDLAPPNPEGDMKLRMALVAVPTAALVGPRIVNSGIAVGTRLYQIVAPKAAPYVLAGSEALRRGALWLNTHGQRLLHSAQSNATAMRQGGQLYMQQGNQTVQVFAANNQTLVNQVGPGVLSGAIEATTGDKDGLPSHPLQFGSSEATKFMLSLDSKKLDRYGDSIREYAEKIDEAVVGIGGLIDAQQHPKK